MTRQITDKAVEAAHPDEIAVDRFAGAMKAKMAKKRAEGRDGWELCSNAYLSRLLREHIDKGDPVDVANFAMMIHQRGETIAPPARPDSFDSLIIAARSESQKAMLKFPQPNYVISKIAEEAGEIIKAAIHCAEGRETLENLRGEMKQLIAMLHRLWVEGDAIHGLPPVCPPADKEG